MFAINRSCFVNLKMHTLQRTNSANNDFIELVKQLDADLATKDGDDHAFYNQFNGIDAIKHVVVAYENGEAIGCGAIKAFDNEAMEVKRMFVSPTHRGKRIATAVLAELEKWAAELSFKRCVLETGKRQADAVQLYQKNGYQVIPNYGQYAGVENSICFSKTIE